MIQQRYKAWLTLAETLIALPVFLIIMTYTYVFFFQRPILGFNLTGDGHISSVYESDVNGNALQPGDLLVQAGSLIWKDTPNHLHQPLLTDLQPGQVLPLVIDRAGQTLTVNWVMPTYGPGEQEQRITNYWWLPYIFLFVGTLTLIVARPKDTTWRLFVLFNYVTALWFSAGSTVSGFHQYEGALVLRVFVWLSIPIYLHFHWMLPKPLARTPHWLWPSLYALTAVVVVLQWFEKIPSNLYLLGFLIAVLGSVILLVLHLVLRPQDRRQIWPVIASSLVGFIPPTLLGWLLSLVNESSSAPLVSLFFFPIVPVAYFLAIYRQKLGALELRANRAVAAYIFITVLATVALLLIALIQLGNRGQFPNPVLVVLILIAGVLAGIYGFAPFQRFIERGLFGVNLPPAEILDASAARIASSLDLPSLTALIRDDLTRSLLIRQSALYLTQTSSPSCIYSQQVESALTATQLADLATHPNQFLPVDQSASSAQADSAPQTWVRLCLPLILNHEQIGLWLLGRRDPDDYYSQADIQVLKTLANQAAVALAHIQQTEQLRLLYENDINQREVERASLARELHDDALNELSQFKGLVDSVSASPELQESYKHVTNSLRHSITELQPTAVNYGLQLALQDLVERTGQTKAADAPAIAIDLEEDTPGTRFDSFVELHLYRVTQQAIRNAFQHAKATQVAVRGHIYDDKVEVLVEDNGIGFEVGSRSDISRLVMDKHFGLAGMYERAQIIGAHIQIHSQPKQGARIQISWQLNPAPI